MVQTGWIPDVVDIRMKSFKADSTWKRLLEGHSYGDVLITISTSELTEEETNATGLVPNHAYAVLGIII